jgi:hypothetical protein
LLPVVSNARKLGRTVNGTVNGLAGNDTIRVTGMAGTTGSAKIFVPAAT